MTTVSLRHLLASTAIASCIILTGSVSSFSATSNGGSKTLPSWSPKSSERLVKLPPSYLKKSLDRDLAESQLGTAIKNNNENGSSFIKLASNLNGNEFQSFMMGDSNLLTKFKIIKSMPKLPFIKELFK